MVRLRVRELAEAKNLNMSQLQRLSGTTLPTVRRYWYNTGDGKADSDKPLQEVNLGALEAIARVLGVGVRDLIENGGESTEAPGNSLLTALVAFTERRAVSFGL